jgi:deazaflavin-dependent oxidoreductase (nitroreductase family)
MTSPNDWNAQIIKEFRANGGKVGGFFEGATMLLLTTTGAKSGRLHTTPLVYLPDGDRFVVIASKGGAPTNPDWYHNLLVNPKATIEVGTETLEVEAEVVSGEERNELYRRQVERRPGFADYERQTTRLIPVVALKRASA